MRAIQIFFFIQKKYLQNNIQYIKLHRLYDKLAILVRYTGFSLKTKQININGQTSVGDSQHDGVSRNDRSLLNNNDENRNKSRRDDDDTMTTTLNNKLLLKIFVRSDTEDCLL